MATMKEAALLLLDCGANMNEPANAQGDSCFSLATECIQWIVNRKLFGESKDELGLILFGHPEMAQPLTVAGRDYQGVVNARTVQLVDAFLLRYVHEHLEMHECTGDFLEALSLAIHCLCEATTGRKFATKRVVLFSNLGGGVAKSDWALVADAFTQNGVELQIIGPHFDEDHTNESTNQNGHPGEDGDMPGPSRNQQGRKFANAMKTKAMLEGETLLRQIFAADVEGESFSFSEALPMLSHFVRRGNRISPWKCMLTLTNRVRVPILMYIKTRLNKTKQTWKRRDPTAMPKSVLDEGTSNKATVMREVIYERMSAAGGDAKSYAADEMTVDKSELVKGYRFGSTLVPFGDADFAAAKFNAEGKCLDMLGFTDESNVARQHYVGETVHYVISDPIDIVACGAFSALVAACLARGKVALARYCYNRASNPRVVILKPKRRKEGKCDVFMVIPVAFADDTRSDQFPAFSESTKPNAEQLNAVDGLIDAMDLSRQGIEYVYVEGADGNPCEAHKPSETCDPGAQYFYSSLRQRLLYADAPLARKPPNAIMKQVSTLPEVAGRSMPALKRLSDNFKLVVNEKKKQKTAAEMFNTATGSQNVNAAPSSNANRQTEPIRIGTLDPVGDFVAALSQHPQRFDDVAKHMVDIIKQLVFESMQKTTYPKALDAIRALRDACVSHEKPNTYVFFITLFKSELEEKSRTDFWRDLCKAPKLGPITQEECVGSALTQTDSDEFMMLADSGANLGGDDKNDSVKKEDDLLDDLE